MAAQVERFIGYLAERRPLCLDSCVLIYHLEGLERYAELTTALLVAAGKGEIPCLISTLAVAEIMVRPLQASKKGQVAVLESFLVETPGLELVALDYEIAKTAAGLRARRRLATPDALLVATGIARGAKAFLSNDLALKKQVGEEIEVVILDDFVSG